MAIIRYEETNANLKYNGTWVDMPNPRFTNGKSKASPNDGNPNTDYISFSFTGIGFKIFGVKTDSYAEDNKCIIDGVEYTFSLKGDTLTTEQMVFEKLGLENKLHNVVIKPGTAKTSSPVIYNRVYVDCVDIITSSIIGDKLPKPEEGWSRFDDDDSAIEYCGEGWLRQSYDNYEFYNKTISACAAPNESNVIKFRFYGTKLRIFTPVTASRGFNKISIDNGPKERFDTKGPTGNFCILVYEKTNLEKGFHDVLIEWESGLHFSLDAIDIDENGLLIPELTKDYEFPVKTIEKVDVEAYAETCTNGEEQLLIAIEDGSQYLTRGDGSYVTCNSGRSLSSTVLFKGIAKDVGEYTLSENATNFKYLIFKTRNGDLNKKHFMFEVKDILWDNTLADTNNRTIVLDNLIIESTGHGRGVIWGSIKDNNKFKIIEVRGLDLDSYAIRCVYEIVGIR